MPLYPTYDNPVPDGASVMQLAAADGVAIRAARWAALAEPALGTVVLLQGRAEMIEKYFETVSELRGRGFHVVTFDWRGQGGSQRLTRNPRMGHVRDFADYEADLDAVMRGVVSQLCPKPWFCLAHSMGGAIALSALHGRKFPVERLVTTAPMIAIHGVRKPAQVLRLARTLRLLGFGKRFIPGGGETSIATKPFSGNPLTSDARRYARNSKIASEHPHLAIGDPTVGWTRAAFALMRRFLELRYPLEILAPVLVLTASEDAVTSTPAIEAFSLRLKAGSAISIHGARHEILMERDDLRAQFWAAFDAFVPGSSAPEKAAQKAG